MLEQQNDKALSILGVNLVYLAAMILLLVVGSYVQAKNFQYGIIITEFVLVAMPVVLFIKLQKKSLIKELRFNKIRLLDAVIVFFIFLSSYFVAAFLNLIGSIILSFFGELIPSPIPIAQNFGEYIVLLLIIAGSAGICEELLFRGLVLRAYEKLGMWKSIIITALLFSLLHLNIQNVFAPAFLGLLLGFVVYQTNSIFAGMLGHFTFNGVSVTLGFLMTSLPQYKAMSPEMIKEGMQTPALVLAALLFGVMALFSGAFMVGCMTMLKERTKQQIIVPAEMKIGDLLKQFSLSWPLYISFVIFIGMISLQLLYMRTGQGLMDLLR